MLRGIIVTSFRDRTQLARFAVALTALAATPAFALGGCADSPENPTWILGLLGAAAAGAPWLRGKLSEWKRRRGG
jgi:XrtJ-associated TM-motif-TM protein